MGQTSGPGAVIRFRGAPSGLLRRGRQRAAPISLLAAAVALPLVLAATAAWSTWRMSFEDARTELTRGAEAAAEYASRVLDSHRAAADRANDLLRGLSDEEIRAREAELHHVLRRHITESPMLRGVHVGDRHGRLLVSAAIFPVPRDIDFSDREYHGLLAAPDAPRTVVTRLYRSRVDDDLFFAVARRRTETGNTGTKPDAFDGQANIAVDPSAIAAGLRRLRPGAEDVVSLVRSDGYILARTAGIGQDPLTARVGASSPMVGPMARGVDSAFTMGRSTLDGVERLAAYRRVEGWPVYVALARPRAVVVQQWWRQALPHLLLGLAASALLSALALTVLRKQRELAVANGALERRVAERTTELAASEAEFRAAFEESPAGKAQTDPWTGRFTRVNSAFCAMLGYSRAELLGGMTLAEVTHSQDRLAEPASIEPRVPPTGRHRREARYLRQDGGEIWVEESTGVIRDVATATPLSLIVTVLDITERKAAEDRLVLLAREVDHRAKNALAVVQAAVRLAPKDDPAAFAKAVEGRVAALARAQVLLAEASWRGTDLRMLAEGTLSAFQPAIMASDHAEPRSEVEGPPVFLAAAAAQPLSLALHELATNAVKYGALSCPGGRIRLDWELDEATGQLRLRWAERGGPPLAMPPLRRGFGSRVLAGTIRDQLGGSVEQRWEPGGLVCDITLPAARAVEAAVTTVAAR